MATKKDLVEAYSFSRRRLVTAFVSGAPGGREVEPARPGRTVVGGLALSVLLIAGAAIAGVFSPRVPDDWTQPGLVISKETGAAYVITDDESTTGEATSPVLRPVLNITSARLILGADATPEIVPQSAIDGQTIGDEMGILGAPASLPAPELLVDSGWTACTDTGRGIRLHLADDPAVSPSPGSGFLVTSRKKYYVVAEGRPESGEVTRAYRYLLPGDADARDEMLGALGLRFSSDATEVSEEWLALFPAGGDLTWDSFELRGAGTPVSYAGGSSNLPEDAEVGQVVDDGTELLLLTEEGPAPLDDFAHAVYRNLPAPHTPDEPLEVDPELGLVTEPFTPAHWPDRLLDPVFGEHCAVLFPEPGQVPAVRLAADPVGEASAADVQRNARSAVVQTGRGAYVLSGDWGDTTEGSPYVVDSTGQSYPLEGAGTAALLGYDGHQAAVVPDSWIELFEPGVTLSRDAALCPPGLEGTCD